MRRQQQIKEKAYEKATMPRIVANMGTSFCRLITASLLLIYIMSTGEHGKFYSLLIHSRYFLTKDMFLYYDVN